MKYIEILSFRIGREEDIATKRRKRKERNERRPKENLHSPSVKLEHGNVCTIDCVREKVSHDSVILPQFTNLYLSHILTDDTGIK